MATSRCAICGREHDVAQMQVGFGKPDVYFTVPEDDRSARCWFNAEQNADICVIRGVGSFMRCWLPIPVRGRSEPFGWGVWAEVERRHIDYMLDHWTDWATGSEPPFAGAIANNIRAYAEGTIGVPVTVQLMNDRRRPVLTVTAVSHRLGTEQQMGVDEAWVNIALHAF